MSYLRRVQRGIDYIEANLDGELDPTEVARHAGVSRWHFQRMFKALTNDTLAGYVRARRFDSAARRLADSEDRIIEIALASGFTSQEAFTRAFKQAFGVTPAEFRHRPHAVPPRLRIDEDYLRQLVHNAMPEPELHAQPELRLVGMMTRFYGVDSEKNNLGAKLPALWSAFLPRLDAIEGRVPGTGYGVVQPVEDDEELRYYAAAEVCETAPVPEGMTEIKLSPAVYARFAHRGAATRIDHTVNYIYSTWLARSGMRRADASDLELYGPGYDPTSHDSVIHYAIPVAPDS